MGNEELLGFVIGDLGCGVGEWLDGCSHTAGAKGCGSTWKSSGWQLVFLSVLAWQSLDAAQVLLYPYLGPDILFSPTSFTDLPRHSLETQ